MDWNWISVKELSHRRASLQNGMALFGFYVRPGVCSSERTELLSKKMLNGMKDFGGAVN
ncbi:hypothetical protein [Paenibacillus graminis]|uniref:hypothetical protein n=1 Tax=Paenibacillus graminis TaxID=189425 RepID=UPI002DC040E1|nr:hypothetical protein [Paenibacillus graminis]MEC0168098.1 hypothetical protein [Paenibacillus graminis]